VPNRKRALITGITGQDGSYLSELLLQKGYDVHGIIRRASTFSTDRIDHIYADPHTPDNRLLLHYGDLSDATGVRRLIERVAPDELYNLAAQSHVRVSFDQPEYTADVVAMGTLRLLESAHDYTAHSGHDMRIYQAGSSEMFGAAAPPQDERTPFHPRSPYAVAKVAAHWFARNYREAYGMFVSNGILFNHESPRRGETFVTRKITRAIGRIVLGLQDHLYLGNLTSRRDWGFAGDYVEAMWLMLQRDRPDDFVVSTDESHSVQEFVELAFGHAGLEWERHVRTDERYMRPSEVDHLEGRSDKARADLGWQPKVSFDELVRMMVDHDIDLARSERMIADAGYITPLRGLAVR
jgi:GDPmannose 4,6-dehydratase